MSQTITAVGYNPFATGNFPGTFGVTSHGYVQGVAEDDPAVRYALCGGLLATTETLPMWGGVPISEYIPVPPYDSMGPTIKRATSVANATGISVMNQAHHALSSNLSDAGLIMPGTSAHFYRFGSGARIAVKMDPILLTIDNGLINQQFSWDFVNQQLAVYANTYAANAFTAMSGSQPNNGVVTVTGTTTTAHGLVPGNSITVSGVTPAGYNGTYTLQNGTTGSTIVYSVPSTIALGTVTTQGTIVAGGGGTALPVRVLKMDVGNSKTVAYTGSSVTATWNNNGSCAIILI